MRYMGPVERKINVTHCVVARPRDGDERVFDLPGVMSRNMIIAYLCENHGLEDGYQVEDVDYSEHLYSMPVVDFMTRAERIY